MNALQTLRGAAALLAAISVSTAASATIEASATVSNLTFATIDLTPNDGNAATWSFISAPSVRVGSRATTYTIWEDRREEVFGDGFFGQLATSTAFSAGSTFASWSGNSIKAYAVILDDPKALVASYAQANASFLLSAHTKVTLTADLVLWGTITRPCVSQDCEHGGAGVTAHISSATISQWISWDKGVVRATDHVTSAHFTGPMEIVLMNGTDDAATFDLLFSVSAAGTALVPETSTSALAALGFAALFMRLKRRRCRVGHDPRLS
jgi:hypothetical protein